MKEEFKRCKTEGSIKINLGSKGVWVADKSRIMAAIIAVCKDYGRDGYVLTLRQLYYQIVAKDLVPNHDKVYKKISKLKDELAMGGYIDWKVLEDRGRVPHTPYYEEGIKGALERTVEYYRLNRQLGQEIHVEVWTEKDAISSILKRVTNYYGVTLCVNKGYSSTTAMYSAFERFSDIINEGRKVKILYFYVIFNLDVL